MTPPRTPVAVILAAAAAVALILLVAGALVSTVRNPSASVDLSPNYSAVINSTLGVLIGSLATWVGATSGRRRDEPEPPTPRPRRPSPTPPAAPPSSTPAPYNYGGQQ